MSHPILTPRAHVRAIFAMGLPLIGGNLAQFAIGLTDTVMIGWYGVPELAALTIATSAFAVLFLAGSGFAWAVMPMVASFAARDDDTSVRRATRMGLWLSAAFFATTMPFLWASAPLLRALGQTDQLAADAATYLRIAGWGLLPALCVMVLKNYLAALEHTRVVFWMTVAAAVANALANYALIFGNLGAPELGIRGAAIASLVSHAVALAGVAAYAVIRLPHHELFRRFWRIDAEMMAQVFRLGWPIGLTTLAEVGLFAATSVMMGWLGTVPLAAHGIALQLATSVFMIHMGLANVATVRAGNAFGRGDPDHLARGAWTVLAVAGLVVALTVVVFFAVPGRMVAIFVDPADPQRAAIIAAGATLVMMAALFQLVDAAQVIVLGLLRGVQDARVPMVIAAVSYWVLGLPASYLIGFTLGFGGPGVWSGLVIGLGVAALLLGLRFWRQAVPRLRAGAGHADAGRAAG